MVSFFSIFCDFTRGVTAREGADKPPEIRVQDFGGSGFGGSGFGAGGGGGGVRGFGFRG